MLIIAGKMYVPAEVRDEWVAAHHDAIKRARAMPGCIDTRSARSARHFGDSGVSISGFGPAIAEMPDRRMAGIIGLWQVH
jgi:2-methylisocitrate lyase-like PEP mutase family enzyme